MVKALPVYMYDLEMNLIKEFKTTKECAIYLNRERDNVNNSVNYKTKIRKDGKWFILKRERVEKDENRSKDN